MKFVHLSDLHIGKRLNEFSLIEDQKYILNEILRIVIDEKPNGVLIAGDVYDKSVPSAEAVTLFDDFLVSLSKTNAKIFVISGNHDSPERIAFGGRLMEIGGVHMSKVYDGAVEPIVMEDEHGTLNVYLLPFVKPANIRQYFEGEEISTYTEAMKAVVASLKIDTTKRNVLVTHQFITGAERSDSEEISVGGTDNIDGTVLDEFDYVALGHIHKPQRILRDTMRYCGSPLKYSFSEAKHKKSVSVITMLEKGKVNVETRELVPMRDMVEIKGKYNDIISKSYYDKLNVEDYYHITLTDEEDVFDAIGKLRIVYKNLMKLDYDNKRTKTNNEICGSDEIEKKKPIELIDEFYNLQNNDHLSEEQLGLLKEMIEEIWGGDQ